MKRRRVIFLPIGLLLVLAVGGRGAATDEKKPGNEVITATRRDLEALRTDGVLPADSKLSLPRLEAPAMEMPSLLPPGAGLAPARPTLSPAPAAKSGNWLIDGMKKNAPRASAERGRDKTDKSGDDLSPDDADDPFGRPKETNDRADNREPARHEPIGDRAAVKDAPNPLTDYMATWMTPRDFNLLLKTDDAASGGAAVASPDMPGQALFLSGSTGMLAAPPAMSAPGTMTMPANSSAGPAENPYLQAIALPPSLAAPSPAMGDFNVAPPPAVSISRPSAPAFQLLPAPDQSTSFRSEIQKRDDDARYFPQLKRF